MASKPAFRGSSLSSSSALETLVYSPFGQLIRMLARKYFIEFNRREGFYILPLCRTHTLLFLGYLTRNTGNSIWCDIFDDLRLQQRRCENFNSRSLIQIFLPTNLFDLTRCTAHSQAFELILGYV